MARSQSHNLLLQKVFSNSTSLVEVGRTIHFAKVFSNWLYKCHTFAICSSLTVHLWCHLNCSIAPLNIQAPYKADEIASWHYYQQNLCNMTQAFANTSSTKLVSEVNSPKFCNLSCPQTQTNALSHREINYCVMDVLLTTNGFIKGCRLDL